MRLNIGSGDHYQPGWVNIDVWPGVHPDITASVLALPLPARSAEAVYAGHVLEHLHLEDVPRALTEIRRVLRPGGRLAVVGPDMDRIADRGADDLYRQSHTGGHRWPGDEHHWDCTATLLHTAVISVFPDAGLVPVESLADRWPLVSPVWWQAAVEGSRT